jgi:Family of unknown function (DUF6152)
MPQIVNAPPKSRSAFIARLFACLLLSVSSTAFAHHGYSAYDMTRIRSAKATITSFELANPHSSIACDITADDGKVEHWSIETGAPMRGMRASGFTPDTLKPGDVVTIYFYPAKNGSPLGAFSKVVFSDGRVMPPPSAPLPGQPSSPNQ